MKKALYILLALNLYLTSLASDDKDLVKEPSKTVLIKITNNTGEEISGAKIIIEGFEKEYITDFEGNVQINLNNKEDIKLKIQSIGFSEKTVKLSQLNTFNNFTLDSL